MHFGEKVRNARTTKSMTQAELAELIGVSLRTIVSYENGQCYPKKREVYQKLASILNLDETYLHIENDMATLLDVKKIMSGEHYAQQLITEISYLFNSDIISDDDMEAIMIAITKSYWIARDRKTGHRIRKYQIREINSGK